MNDFYVYILRCADDSLYVGHTDNLEKRLAEHHDGKFCGYTSRRRPIQCVFSENFQSRDEAFCVERKIKNWSKSKKEALIKENFSLLQTLSKKKFDNHSTK